MEDLSKYLPTPEMQAEFEVYKNMTPKERSVFRKERAKRIDSLPAEEKVAHLAATKQGLIAIKESLQEINLALKLGDVANVLSLSYIAKVYFGKSKAWLYQRLNGYKVNGKPAQFTEEERKIFVKALHDLSRQIEDTALKLA